MARREALPASHRAPPGGAEQLANAPRSSNQAASAGREAVEVAASTRIRFSGVPDTQARHAPLFSTLRVETIWALSRAHRF